MHSLLKVAERTERGDGTVRIMLIDAANGATCSVHLLETAEQPYRVGDRYELTLRPLARVAQPARTDPARPASLDVVATVGGKATVETIKP